MGADHQADYLAGVGPENAALLAGVNRAGLRRLRSYLESEQAVAFLGAGSSSPLYPLWAGVISELVDAAVEQGLEEDAAGTCRAMAAGQPDSVVELLRRYLGVPRYQAVLREVFRVRRDPESGRTWTPTQELVCRCPFTAVVTTNYDPGIVDARMWVRPQASSTGFTSWTDELALDRWRTGEVFGDQELPVLFAHGHHNQPEAMVLATTEYRRAYAGKLARVLSRMLDGWHLVWIGFSFADQHINGVLREVAEHAGTRVEPGVAPRHVALMAWDPDHGGRPQTLKSLAEIEYGADLILYPAPGGDHSALQRLVADFVVDSFPPAPAVPPPSPATRTVPASTVDGVPTPPPPAVPVRWVPPVETVEGFTGRVEELARLDRWAADPTVRLVGVTAWGGAGKTSLVTHWLDRHGGVASRPGLRGVFGWSFYADPSADHWAKALLEWTEQELDLRLVRRRRLAATVLALLEAVPLVVVLDGLEVTQEGPEGVQFGRLLDGTLREVLTGACRLSCGGLVMLTSRFAFADLEGFDGGAARMLDVPPFTPTEGAALLAASGAGWLSHEARRDLVRSVDGHALAVAALGSLLTERPPTDDLERLRAELGAAAATNSRVAKVLRFYADQLSAADRYLVAGVGLFARPVTPHAVLTVAGHASFGGHLDSWTPQQVEAAARERLAGLLSWHPDGTLSAHPLVRETFRPLAMSAAEIAAETTLTDVIEGRIDSQEDALRVVEAIELLLDADQWHAADDLYRVRTDEGQVWRSLPAARLGQRAASAFVATPTRRQVCRDWLTPGRLGFYLNEVGLRALHGGDLATAREYLDASLRHHRDADHPRANLATSLRNLAECLGSLGDVGAALRTTAEAAIHASSTNDLVQIRKAAAYEGWVAMLAGDSRAAEEYFLAADRIELASEHYSAHLYSLRGAWWGEFLARTGRPGPARTLTDRNREISTFSGWREDLARCDRLLARLDLAAGDPTTAERRLIVAAATYRDGDYLVELAATLPVLADSARASGDLAAATRHVEEAFSIAGPRGLLPSHATALVVRARICADQVGKGSPYHLARGRDAADAAHRIATRHRLAWQELDALDAHARLDQIEGVDRNWMQRAAALRARLIPAGLDPDPLGTVERQVAEDRDRGPDDTGRPHRD
jgi:tetratricopeptide (TPR) repeat protein